MACLRLLPLATDSTHVMWSLSGLCFSKLIGRQAKLQHLGCSFSVFTGSREGSVVLWVLLISGCDGVGLGLLELSGLNDMLYTWSPRFILCTNDIIHDCCSSSSERRHESHNPNNPVFFVLIWLGYWVFVMFLKKKVQRENKWYVIEKECMIMSDNFVVSTLVIYGQPELFNCYYWVDQCFLE